MALHIQKESVPNPDIIHWNTSVEICETRIASFERPLRESSSRYLDEVGGKGGRLIREAMAIPGVIQIFITPYEISVEKASSLFKWEDIEPVVEKSLRVIFGGEKEREDVKYLSLAEIPIALILMEPFKRLGWLIRKAWYRIPNLAQ